MFRGTIVQTINVDFELAAICLKKLTEWEGGRSFEEIVKITPVGFQSLPGFLQAGL
jgi:hypothetical protein